VDSLRVAPDGTYVAQVPDLPRSGALETSHIDELLVLRVIVQCEVATAEDIVASLRLPTPQVLRILRLFSQEGWVDSTDDGHHIRDRRYGTVIRALNRRNLVTTTGEVGVL
jgi:DNA-binding IclR family transcriptional regulator